jgi:hypothetical protein
MPAPLSPPINRHAYPRCAPITQPPDYSRPPIPSQTEMTCRVASSRPSVGQRTPEAYIQVLESPCEVWCCSDAGGRNTKHGCSLSRVNRRPLPRPPSPPRPSNDGPCLPAPNHTPSDMPVPFDPHRVTGLTVPDPVIQNHPTYPRHPCLHYPSERLSIPPQSCTPQSSSTTHTR